MLLRRTLPAVVIQFLVLSAGATAQAVDVAADAPPNMVQQAYLKASNTGSLDIFGWVVAVSGNTVAVGAPREDSASTGVNGAEGDGAADSGAVYVFVRDGAGWSQQAYIKASNTGPDDYFGFSLALSGDTLVVGADWEDSGAAGVDGDQDDESATDAGAAYVFVRNGTTWSQQAYLKASNAGALDHFGISVGVSGDTIVVGSRSEDSAAIGVNGDESSEAAPESGAAYVFRRNGTAWTQEAYLKASNAGINDWFGEAVAVSGDTVVVGARFEQSAATGVGGEQGDDSLYGAGAAYIFVRDGDRWSQQAYLKASNTDLGDWFGHAVAVSGDTLVVGAFAEDSSATGVDGDQGDDSAGLSGAAYVFARSGASWSQQAYLKASNTEQEDHFGASVTAWGDAVVVGAYNEDSRATGINGDQDDNSAMWAGAAYLFVREGTTWSQLAYLKASNTGAFDSFGFATALAGDTMVIGACREASASTGVDGDQTINGSPASGASYVFDLDLDAWTDVGLGLAGTSAAPLLEGVGPLTPLSSNQLALKGAPPLAAATLVVGLAPLGAPFKGGTLVPAPLLLVPLATNASGALTLPFTWPSGVPAGALLYFQLWISDPGAVAGFAASNGLKGTSG